MLVTKFIVLANHFYYYYSGFPPGLENRENREKKYGQGKVREKSGNFIFIQTISNKIKQT
jgi:hypothetical protein